MIQLHGILSRVDRLIVAAERHPASARRVERLAVLACLGGLHARLVLLR